MHTKTKSKPHCINPGCKTKGEQHARGLCEPCYRQLARLVDSGMVGSWKEAENRGMCKQRKSAGGRFEAQLDAIKRTTRSK